MTLHRVMAVIGTRPEVIKLAPVIDELNRRDDFEVRVCTTAQHRELLDQALQALQIGVDIDLDVMSVNQRLGALTGAVVSRMEEVIAGEKPDVVLVQGDTTTAFGAALAAFYARVPTAHVEAGLRTGDPTRPFPEEINRRLIGGIAALHFAPTERARQSLLREGIKDEQIEVTGNTVIDALLATASRLDDTPALASKIAAAFPQLRDDARLILITGHRRENFGAGFEGICDGIAAIATAYPDVDLIYPVHLNPNVKGVVHERLAGLTNVYLIDPVDYLSIVYLMRRSHFVLTDSGGIQEEAPGFARPVLVMREKTERPEAVEAGTARLVGTDAERIMAEARRLLDDEDAHAEMAKAHNPFGDGHAAPRIVDRLQRFFS